ncbi:MAG TPA: hypothetical protein VIX41_02230, partial [Acidimicrobiales bacterium]
MQPGHRPTEHRVVRITARSAVVGVLVLVAGVVAQRILVAAHRPLSWLVAAIVVAVLIDPIVDFLDRHIPRLAAVVVARLVVGGAAFAVTYVAFDNLADGLDRLGRAAEDAADDQQGADDRGQPGDVAIEQVDDRVDEDGDDDRRHRPRERAMRGHEYPLRHDPGHEDEDAHHRRPGGDAHHAVLGGAVAGLHRGVPYRCG